MLLYSLPSLLDTFSGLIQNHTCIVILEALLCGAIELPHTERCFLYFVQPIYIIDSRLNIETPVSTMQYIQTARETSSSKIIMKLN